MYEGHRRKGGGNWGIFRSASDYLTFRLVGKMLYHDGDGKKSRLSLPKLEKIITSELQNRVGVFDRGTEGLESVLSYRAAHPNENKYEPD